MKKHLSAIILVLLLLFAVYLLGRPNHTAAPAPPNRQSTTLHKQSAPPTPVSFNKKQYSLDDPASIWVVVNKRRPLNPKDYAPSDLVSVGHGQQMRAEAASALSKMLAGAQAAGYTVTPASGYRSYTNQVNVYNSEVQAYGQQVADSESARPGYSEHQTGLAMDLASGGCSISDCFGDTPGGKWITANAYKYGFILRYPADKVAITGYRHETWHFRYVGVELATEMHQEGAETLEEFFGLPAAPDYQQ